MNAVKVDPERRIQLGILTPGDVYEPEIRSVDEIMLRRVERKGGVAKLTKAEVLHAIEVSELSPSIHKFPNGTCSLRT